MGRLLDKLYEAIELLREEPMKIINESFMMGIFVDFELEIPPYKNYIDYLYNTKTQYKVVRDRIKYQPFKELRKELFNPTCESNIETNCLIENLGIITANTLIDEFRDIRKATRNHLSCVRGIYSWNHISDEEKKAGLGLYANNDVSESAFGGLTEALIKSSMISLAHAGAMSQTRRNGDFSRTLLYARRKKTDRGNFLFLNLINTNIS